MRAFAGLRKVCCLMWDFEVVANAVVVCKELDAIEKGKRVGRVDSMQEGLEW